MASSEEITERSGSRAYELAARIKLISCRIFCIDGVYLLKMSATDYELVQRYANKGAEAQPAFTALVEGHLDLVYSVARRQLGVLAASGRCGAIRVRGASIQRPRD